jgi:hypothetical protein
MSPLLTYNLNSIPGFNSILSDDIDSVYFNKIKYNNKANQNYQIIRYNKEMMSPDLVSSIGLLRSVVINSCGKIVSFAPPKSFSFDTFTESPENELNTYIVAEEFIEGTMINVFWDETSGITGGWEIATRNTVGAEVSFYKNANAKTFRKMFLDAAHDINLNLNLLNPQYCYSFVLQHPENRIVVPFNKTALYLVEVYEIIVENGVTYVSNIDPEIVKYYSFWSETGVRFPKVYNFENYNELKDLYASMNTSYDILGFIIKNRVTCQRCKLRNPVYEYVRNLKGNQPKLQYQYLCLRQQGQGQGQGKMSEFLKYYPENKKDFSLFRKLLHDFTTTLYQNYISCYIKKEKPLIEFPDNFRTHMFHIHTLYRDVLKPDNKYVNNLVVINYVNGLHPSLQMYGLNASLHKRRIDFIKADYGN